MKKESSKVLDIFCVILIIAIVILGALYGVRSFNYYSLNEDIKNLTQISDCIYSEVEVSEEELAVTEDLMSRLPQSLMNEFLEHNGKVIIVDDLDGDIVGKTLVSMKGDMTIYIESGFEFDALLHEFGHVYLHLYPKAMNQRFRNIYEQEAKSLVTAYYGDAPYYYKDKTEYFAQAFQTVLYLGGNDIQEAAPATFNFMSALINDMFNEKEAM